MREIPISQIRIGNRLRKDVGDIQSLADSMEDVGLLHPVVINEDNGELIAGYRRVEAAKLLGWKSIEYRKISIDDPRIAEIDENEKRKDFNASETVAVKRYIEKQKHPGRPSENGGKLPPFERGDSRDIASKITRHSSRQIDKMERIVEAAEQNPKYKGLLREVDNRETSVDSAYKKIILEQNKKLPKLKLPPGKYNLVIWDPSWPHDIKVAGGSGTSGNAQRYRPETMEELKSKGLQHVLAKDAILGIWTLPTFHEEVLEIIKANGFEKIKTKIYWDKMVPSMGFNFRNQVEELCICVRGNVKAFWQTAQPNIIRQKSERPHSRKPDIFFEIMEKAAKAGLPRHKLSKLEINATQPRKGWVTVGNQIRKDKIDLQEKCTCNHPRILHNDDQGTGEEHGGVCVYEMVTCGCRKFTQKKRRLVTA